MEQELNQVTQEDLSQAPSMAPPKKSTLVIVSVIMMVLLLLTIIAIFVVYFVKGSKPESKITPTPTPTKKIETLQFDNKNVYQSIKGKLKEKLQ